MEKNYYGIQTNVLLPDGDDEKALPGKRYGR